MAELFHITHDANDFSEYDTAPSGGAGSEIELSAAAGLGGTPYGLEIDSGGTADSGDLDFGGSSASGVARFGFRSQLNTLSLSSGDTFEVLFLDHDTIASLVEVYWVNSGSGAKLEVWSNDDAGDFSFESSANLANSDTTFEVVVTRATSAVSSDGKVELYINGSLDSSITGRDNYDFFEDYFDTGISVFEISPNNFGATGIMYVDEFVVRDDNTQIYPVPSTFTGQRALVQAIDQEAGAQIYLTSWEDGNLYLYNRALSDLSETSKADFGAATATNLAARNNYLAPYTPAFPDITGFGDYVYAYGRWNDGSVKHLALSTSAGATGTFGSNLGDATWGSDWVGAFFADDTSTFYAFVNGSSRALWRSVDGGSNWSSLSSLPFDVDPGGAVKHPDGRILIINRSTGSQMAAIAQPPDYSSWVDATGSPAFPQAGGGARSVKWIV